MDDLLQINACDSGLEEHFSSSLEKEKFMLKVSILVWIMLGTVLAGVGLMAVLLLPSFAAQAMKNIPLAVLIGFLVAMPLSYLVAGKISGASTR